MVDLDGIQWLPLIGAMFVAFPLVALGYYLPHVAWLGSVLAVGAGISGVMVLVVVIAVLISTYS